MSPKSVVNFLHFHGLFQRKWKTFFKFWLTSWITNKSPFERYQDYIVRLKTNETIRDHYLTLNLCKINPKRPKREQAFMLFSIFFEFCCNLQIYFWNALKAADPPRFYYYPCNYWVYFLREPLFCINTVLHFYFLHNSENNLFPSVW